MIEANETLEQRVQDRTKDLQDMTEDLDSARAEAEGANASKTRFLAAASHDLLQPLNAARLFLGAVDAGEKHANQELLAKADRAVRSADELLKGLLDISRLDHSNVEPQPKIIPLGPLLEDLADEARPMAQTIGLDLRVAPTSLRVKADPDFLQSIIRNFVSNARRYSQKGGVLIGARREGLDHVRVEVWDTGPVIAEHQREKLFQEFERLTEQDNLGIRGAGLGLAVASRMASLMGTKIDVRSRVGHGSVFSVRLPRVGVKASVAARPIRQVDMSPAQSIAGLNVLCVDDEQLILDGMHALLGHWGCHVHTAQTIEEAWAIFEREPIQVVIADYQLKQDETGLDMLARMMGSVPDIGVSLLTAEATSNVFDSAK